MYVSSNFLLDISCHISKFSGSANQKAANIQKRVLRSEIVVVRCNRQNELLEQSGLQFDEFQKKAQQPPKTLLAAVILLFKVVYVLSSTRRRS